MQKRKSPCSMAPMGASKLPGPNYSISRQGSMAKLLSPKRNSHKTPFTPLDPSASTSRVDSCGRRIKILAAEFVDHWITIVQDYHVDLARVDWRLFANTFAGSPSPTAPRQFLF